MFGPDGVELDLLVQEAPVRGQWVLVTDGGSCTVEGLDQVLQFVDDLTATLNDKERTGW